MNAITKALSTASAMRVTKGATVDRIVASGRGHDSTMRLPNTAAESFRHLRGWVWSAVRLIATRIAGQSIHVGRKPTGPRSGKAMGTAVEPLDSHPLLDVLHDPNDYQTRWALVWSVVASLQVAGRALLWCSRGERRTIVHIPTNWLISVDAKRTTWTVRPDGATTEFPISGDEVVHFSFPDPSDPLGCVSPLSRIAEAIVCDEEISQAQWAAFRNGIFPKVVLTAGRLPDANGMKGERPVLEPEQRADLIAAIKGAYAGTLNADEPFIIDGLIERIDKLSHSIAEMDFLDSSSLTKAKVLQGFGVSPILLGEVEGANRASATVADEIFTANTVNPLIELMSQCLTEWLGPMFAGPREKLCVWIEPTVANGDPELSLKRWEAAARMGYVSGDEFRVHVLNIEAAGLTEYRDPAMMLPRTTRSMKVNGDNPYTLGRLVDAN